MVITVLVASSSAAAAPCCEHNVVHAYIAMTSPPRERRPERVIEEIEVPDWYVLRVLAGDLAPRRAPSTAVPNRAEDLFKRGLRSAVMMRRLPFNISIVNDEMRRRDRRFNVQRDLNCTFSEFSKAYVGLAHVGRCSANTPSSTMHPP